MNAEGEKMAITTEGTREVAEQELHAIYLTKNLEPRPGEKVRLFVNMVRSLDGVINPRNRAGVASQEGLTHPVDQRLMRRLRFHADAIVNGSNTLELSGADSVIDEQKYPDLIAKRRELGKPDNPISCVVTSNADFGEEILNGQFFKDPRFQSILFVGERAPADNLERIKQATMGKKFEIISLALDENGMPDVKTLVDILHDKFNVKSILSEGGARLNGSLLRAGILTDLFETVAPVVVGWGPDSKGMFEIEGSFPAEELARFEPVSTFTEPTSRMRFLHSAKAG